MAKEDLFDYIGMFYRRAWLQIESGNVSLDGYEKSYSEATLVSANVDKFQSIYIFYNVILSGESNDSIRYSSSSVWIKRPS